MKFFKRIVLIFTFFLIYNNSSWGMNEEEQKSLSILLSIERKIPEEPQTALITGATRGIGFALTEKLLGEGLHVIAVARKVELLERLATQFPDHLRIISADLSTNEGQLSVAPAVGKTMVDYLVHNAGIIEPLGKNALLDASSEEIRRIIEVNLIAPMVITNQLSLNLKHGSRILMISSRSGERVSPGVGLYSVTKTAIDRYTGSLKLDKPYGVLAASVHPGDVNTDMHADLRSKDTIQFPRAEFFREKQSKLISANISGQYLTWLLLKTNDEFFISQKHNIYDESHQANWNNEAFIEDPYK